MNSIRQLASPHHNPRPAGVVIDLLVVHAISLPPGEFGTPHVDQLFLGTLDPTAHPAFAELAGLRVAAHFLIDRQGAITQYVPIARRAWHAGVSSWEGRENCNDYSVGVELEGTADLPFTPAQYRRLAALIRTLQLRLPGVTDQRIVGHQQIAPTRKWDPGPQFDWHRLRQLLKEVEAIPASEVTWE